MKLSSRIQLAKTIPILKVTPNDIKGFLKRKQAYNQSILKYISLVNICIYNQLTAKVSDKNHGTQNKMNLCD